jgi:hypothetical protein
VSDWIVEVGSPPDEISALLRAGMSREASTPTHERQGAGFGAHDPLSALSVDVLVPDDPALTEARRLPENTIGLSSW